MAQSTDPVAGKVLIIEDRRENIVFIANKILKPEGWEIITARDGQLGLQKAIEERPDLLITDLKLPKMHGLDVLEELNRRGIHIPSIVMTFHGSEETAIRAFRLGAADYLIKPFSIEEMMAAIDRALQGRGARPGPSAGQEAGLSETVARQERELQRLKSLLQQKEQVLQQLQQAGAAGPDAARWQALLKERESALTNLQKQMVAQTRAMTQEINQLKAQLAEKEAIVREMQSRAFEAASASGIQSESSELSARLAEKERALVQAEKLVRALTRTVAAQQKAIEKHREEAERLARELHALAAGIQMLGQSLGDQAGQMASILSGEE